MASASGKVTPENAGHKIDVQHPDFTEALRVSSTTSGSENVMAEAGVDISGQHSKLVGALSGAKFDCVVSVCGHAHESCPIFPGRAKVVHVGFDDPPRLAAGAESEDERLAPYRRVCGEIRAFVETLPEALVALANASRTA